jgi:fumarate hydratase subunit alpha
MIREIPASTIEDAVCSLFLQANFVIDRDIARAVQERAQSEDPGPARASLEQIAQSYDIAARESIAICQDTGLAVLFAQVGQDVHIDGDFTQAVNQGVRRAYDEGYLRASVVDDPLFDRTNTRDNTPAVIHTELVPGDRLTLIAVPKGFGSENCSRAKMFPPAASLKDIRDFVVETVRLAGPNTCPPSILGVGIGGSLEKAALLAKRSLARPLNEAHPDPRYAQLEREWLDAINDLGIGPAGLGGRTTALAVHIGSWPTHIASIPVVVNLCCHAARHARCVL